MRIVACLFSLLLSSGTAFALPQEVVQQQGRTVRVTGVTPVTAATPAQCVVSYDSSQCTASGVPFSCCTGVSTGTCACSGGATYNGDVMAITVQNNGGAVAYCANAPATPIPAGTPGLQIGSGAALTLDKAARGVSLNCRTSSGTAAMQVLIESR